MAAVSSHFSQTAVTMKILFFQFKTSTDGLLVAFAQRHGLKNIGFLEMVRTCFLVFKTAMTRTFSNSQEMAINISIQTKSLQASEDHLKGDDLVCSCQMTSKKVRVSSQRYTIMMYLVKIAISEYTQWKCGPSWSDIIDQMHMFKLPIFCQY